MNSDNIVYQAKLGGYIYIYDKSGFISVFETLTLEPDTKDNFIYSSKVDCNSRKDFEMEIIFINKIVSEL